MDSTSRITVSLSRAELEALIRNAQRDYRHPRDQARYLLRRALMGEQPPDPPPAPVAPMTNGAAVSQANGAALATV